MRNYTFRLAKEQDAAALLSVYAPYVENTAVTFEYEVPSVEEFARRIREILSFYPWLVCETEGEILGYAYANRHKERAAYQWDCELSVYIKEAAVGKGLGTVLYRALIRILEHQNVYNLYACVTMPNEKSERLHAALGFSPAGIWHHSGYKHGAWHDVAWYEKTCPQLPSADTDLPDKNQDIFALTPKPLLPVHAIDPTVLNEILSAPVWAQ